MSTWGFLKVTVPGDDHGAAGSGGFGTGTRDGELDPELLEPEPSAGNPDAGTGTGLDSGTGLTGVIVGTGARFARTGTRRANSMLGRLAGTPGSVVHSAAHCQPMTIAEHAVHARLRDWVPDGQDPDGALGAAGEFTQRTAGRLLKIGGTAVSRLADNPVAQWIAIAIALLISIAIWRLVF